VTGAVAQAPGVGDRDTTWSWRWETSLDVVAHTQIAALLARSYARRSWSFTDARSWFGARPELRVVGCRDGEPVAHAGVVRRFLRAPDHDVSLLVGDVGLVAVHPDLQGERLGSALMGAVAAVLTELAVPYGFLTCDSAVRPFYERCGWTAMTDHVVRSIRVDQALEEHRRNAMLLPVTSSVDAWPSGPIERNGQEI